MNRMTTITLGSLLLLSATQVLAQERHRDRDRRDERNQRQEQVERNQDSGGRAREQIRGVPATRSARPAHDAQGQPRQQQQAYPGQVRQERREDRRDNRQERRQDRQDYRQDRREDRRDVRQDRHDDRRDWRQDRRDDRRDYRHDRRDDRRDYRHDRRDNRHDRRDWRRDRRFDNRNWRRGWNDWRSHWYHGWSGSRYRSTSRYYHPRGHHLRSWYVGLLLPRVYYAPSYYIDWRYYGLSSPPWGCEWIRISDDLLLVDLATGEVLDVLNNFWY